MRSTTSGFVLDLLLNVSLAIGVLRGCSKKISTTRATVQNHKIQKFPAAGFSTVDSHAVQHAMSAELPIIFRMANPGQMLQSHASQASAQQLQVLLDNPLIRRYETSHETSQAEPLLCLQLSH